ncbi:MAG: IS66 family transposase [Streptosporangiaceae bacterium]
MAPGTLAGAARRLDGLLAPLAAAITARNAAAGHAHADETSWRVLGQPADNGGSRWRKRTWVFTGPGTVVCTIAPSRSLKVLEDHYGVRDGQLPAGRGPLVLSSDFYSVYQSFSELDGVAPPWCWAHIRRYFIRAAHRKNPGSWADARVMRIGVLYAAHRRLAAAPEGTPGHAGALRKFTAALEEIDARRRIQGARPDLLHPAAAKVLATLDREWDGLAAHRDFPDLPLDNNTAERAIRAGVTGRKNYNGSGSRWAAELAGHSRAILGTARLAGHNPRACLEAYLHACAEAGGKPPAGQAMEALLPWNISIGGQPAASTGKPP